MSTNPLTMWNDMKEFMKMLKVKRENIAMNKYFCKWNDKI